MPKKVGISTLLVAAAVVVVAGVALARGGGGTGSDTCAATTGPNGDVTWTPAVVWPPNHKLVPIRFSWTETPDALDAAGGNNTLSVNSITSTGVDDKGAGQPSSKQGPDYSGVGNSGTAPNGHTVTVTAYVRAERSGTDKAGRVYTVDLSCNSPDDGNGSATAVITVPHDMGNHSGKTSARRLSLRIAR